MSEDLTELLNIPLISLSDEALQKLYLRTLKIGQLISEEMEQRNKYRSPSIQEVIENEN